MHHGTGKSKKKGRLKDKMKTVVATSAHNTTSSKISSDVLMKNNTAVIALNRAIAAGGGLGSAGVSPELTAVPGGDGRAELANIWRMKAKMLYQMRRMKQAFECCNEAAELLPGDEE